MYRILFVIFCSIFCCSCKAQLPKVTIVTSDIPHFWEAYDKITATQDSVLQYQYLDSLYLQKESVGLAAMRKVRRYTTADYIEAIEHYPKFWNSIRANTLQLDLYTKELTQGIYELQKLYPDLKPARIYFTIGALRSNGTTLDSLVLIGTELTLATPYTPTDEFPEKLSYLKDYFSSDPSEHLVFLNIHEVVHTQQKTTIGENLLAQTVIEGVAEFVAVKALHTPSPNPQIAFGKAHAEAIKTKFATDMFSPYTLYQWLWNSPDNEFGMRDLAYYVGYQICEDYYNAATNKEAAIKEMITLDYNNEVQLMSFVDKAGYFDKPMATFKKTYEVSRPIVEGLGTLHNHSNTVTPNMQELTIQFSKPMDTRFRSFEIGSLGTEHLLKITDFKGFSEDGTTATFSIDKLLPAKKYQLIVGSGFRTLDGVPLVPYLIEFTTSDE